MQRRERRAAERDGRPVRTLMEADYLLGVADVSRLGALRFRRAGDTVFQAPGGDGVPGLVALGRLLQVTERILRDEETDEDLQIIFAPGSSLGGARPKASVIDQQGRLAIAKFPKETDEYSVELWEAVALQLAQRAGIATPEHELIEVAGRPVSCLAGSIATAGRACRFCRPCRCWVSRTVSRDRIPNWSMC